MLQLTMFLRGGGSTFCYTSHVMMRFIPTSIVNSPAVVHDESGFGMGFKIGWKQKRIILLTNSDGFLIFLSELSWARFAKSYL